jgi:hypothetical protein
LRKYAKTKTGKATHYKLVKENLTAIINYHYVDSNVSNVRELVVDPTMAWKDVSIEPAVRRKRTTAAS